MQKGQIQIILIGILVVVMVAAGAYYLGRSTTSKQSTAPVSPTPQSTPSTTDETVYTESDRSANWKTYTNSKVGFQIKYPPRYPKPALPSGMAGSPTIYTTGDEDNVEILFGEMSDDAFGMIVFPFSGTLNEIVNTQQAKGLPPYNWIPSNDISVSTKEIIIGGVRGRHLVASHKNVSYGKKRYSAIFFVSKNHGFILGPSPDYEEKELQIIISNFKFL